MDHTALRRAADTIGAMPYITLDQASLAYGHYPLLDHANFQLDGGERVGLIGRNGAGKSSLLKVITGESKLDDGTLSVEILHPNDAFIPSYSVDQSGGWVLAALKNPSEYVGTFLDHVEGNRR